MKHSEYETISKEAYTLSGVLMKQGEFMDATKRRIVFVTLQTLFNSNDLFKGYVTADTYERGIAEKAIVELVLKELSKNENYISGHEYMMWRKHKIGRFGNREQLIEHILDLITDNIELTNKIKSK